MSTRGEVLVGHEQMLVLAGRIGRDRAEAEVVEALDQGALVLLLSGGGGRGRGRCGAGVDVTVGRRGADRTEITAAGVRSTGTGGAVHASAGTLGASGAVDTAAVELMTGKRARVEIGRRELGAGIEIGR